MINKFKNTLWLLFFRFADRLISPKLFLANVPKAAELRTNEGRLSLEIVSHCWQYSHLMAYNLSAYVNYPPKEIDVTVTVFYSPEDIDTVDTLNFFEKNVIEGVTWNWQPLATEALFRRAIGRNKAALATKADWIWYIDCDLIFYEGCLDALNQELQNRNDILLFPNSENITPLLDSENLVLKKHSEPKTVDIDISEFYQNKISRAVGAYQITHGDIARSCGYCNNISVYQTPEAHWRKTYEDRTYRWLIGSQGKPINVPSIYRIRHQEKGRYSEGTLLSKVRKSIRFYKSKVEDDKNAD